MKEYYKSTRLARLLTKFVMQDISEGEKKELVSLARKAGVNIQKIIQDVAEKEMTLGNDDAEIETGKKVWLSTSETSCREAFVTVCRNYYCMPRAFRWVLFVYEPG